MSRIVMIESEDQPYRCSCSNGLHTWYADEPLIHEGLDTGPSPGELLLSAIGTCATITLRMYAKRKMWPVEKIRLELRMEEVKTETGGYHKIYESLSIDGPIDEEQYMRLKSLLPKCPVTKIVMGTVEIVYQ